MRISSAEVKPDPKTLTYASSPAQPSLERSENRDRGQKMANTEHLSNIRDLDPGAWNAWRTANPSIRPDLKEADLGRVDLSGADLSYAELSGAILNEANLERANLHGATLRNAYLERSILRETDLSMADLTGANLSMADLTGANFIEANLGKTNFTHAMLRDARLNSASIISGDLSFTNLEFADLSYTELTDANLSMGNFRNANFTKARLLEADLSGADFSGAIFDGAVIKNYKIYNRKMSELDTAYGNLSFIEAIRARGIFYIILSICSVTWGLTNFFMMVGRVLSNLYVSVLPLAFAAPSGDGVPPFTPPLGIPQNIFTIIVLIFVGVLAIIIVALVYAGFIAKPKSTKAASVVEHFGSFLLGALFGTKV
jgi:uncharacterized protein YjbI with pentapeptide repeats